MTSPDAAESAPPLATPPPAAPLPERTSGLEDLQRAREGRKGQGLGLKDGVVTAQGLLAMIATVFGGLWTVLQFMTLHASDKAAQDLESLRIQSDKQREELVSLRRANALKNKVTCEVAVTPFDPESTAFPRALRIQVKFSNAGNDEFTFALNHPQSEFFIAEWDASPEPGHDYKFERLRRLKFAYPDQAKPTNRAINEIGVEGGGGVVTHTTVVSVSTPGYYVVRIRAPFVARELAELPMTFVATDFVNGTQYIYVK